jgi:uncharacterized membrane protein YqaE (UPF0057 family)
VLRLLAILLPPVAVLLVGRPMQALFNCLLCMFVWLPGAIHAWGIVSDYKSDKRLDKQTKSIIKEQRERERRQLQIKLNEEKMRNKHT